jgi:hypothetical protein
MLTTSEGLRRQLALAAYLFFGTLGDGLLRRYTHGAIYRRRSIDEVGVVMEIFVYGMSLRLGWVLGSPI